MSSSPRRACREQAPEPSIARTLSALAAHPLVDVVVLARGGGSFEDLLPVQRRARRARRRSLRGAGRLGRRSRAGHAALRPGGGRAGLDTDCRGTPRRARPRRAPHAARARAGDVRTRHATSPRARPRASRPPARATDRAAPRLLLERRHAALDRTAARLQALSPRATLERGYAIVRAEGAALRDASTHRNRCAASTSSSPPAGWTPASRRFAHETPPRATLAIHGPGCDRPRLRPLQGLSRSGI